MEMSAREAGEASLLAQIHATDEDIVAAEAQYEAIDWGRSLAGASHPLGGDASCIFRALAWLSIEPTKPQEQPVRTKALGRAVGRMSTAAVRARRSARASVACAA